MRVFLISLLGLFVLAGCRWRSVPIIGHLFPDPATVVPPGPKPADITSLLLDVAAWASVVGAFAIVLPVALCIVFPTFRAIGGRVAIAGLGLVVSAQLLVWVGEHVAAISAVVLLLSLVAACWKHRKKIVDRVECATGKDLDGKPNDLCPVIPIVESIDVDEPPGHSQTSPR